MRIYSLVTGSFSTNCYLIVCNRTLNAIVFDPGFEKNKVNDFINRIIYDMLQVKYISNTHGHMDHISGNRVLKEATCADILIHKNDAEMLVNPSKNLSKILKDDVTSPRADYLLQEGAIIKTGDIELKVIHTTGHSKGSISLLSKNNNIVFTGDTLFAGSIGRTDLYGSSFVEIMRSLKERLMVLPHRMLAYPGHGERTTIGREKEDNPFLKADI